MLDEKLGSEGKKFELPKNKVLDTPGANSSGDLQSRNWNKFMIILSAGRRYS